MCHLVPPRVSYHFVIFLFFLSYSVEAASRNTRSPGLNFTSVLVTNSARLVALNENMRSGDNEAFSQALTSCRRLLATVADAIFPPRAEPYVDRHGKERAVGVEQYKNRLLAYLADRVDSAGSFAILDTDLAPLAARLDAIYEKACKGVHADVDQTEAQLTVIHTYLFLAEVVRHASLPPEPLKVPRKAPAKRRRFARTRKPQP